MLVRVRSEARREVGRVRGTVEQCEQDAATCGIGERPTEPIHRFEPVRKRQHALNSTVWLTYRHRDPERQMANSQQIEHWNGETGQTCAEDGERYATMLQPFGDRDIEPIQPKAVKAHSRRRLRQWRPFDRRGVEVVPDGMVIGLDISGPMLVNACGARRRRRCLQRAIRTRRRADCRAARRVVRRSVQRFEIVSSKSHGYLQTTEPEYMLTLVVRGADALASSGRIGSDLSTSLKAEAGRRAEADEFYGFIGFASFIARKP